jgi:hypothetical protein
MTETYENARDNSEIVPQDVRRQWIEADQQERMLRGQYEKFSQDTDLVPEARARLAHESYEKMAPRIESKKKATREALLKQAKFAEQAAIPRPSGEPLSSSDPTKLVADQNEAARIVRTVERRKDAPGPFRHDTGAYLTQEYKRGLEIGGTEGGAICRGTLRAAGELGVSAEVLLQPLRGDRHRDSLDRARRLYLYADMISTKAAPIPRKLDGRNSKSRVAGSYRSAPSALVPGAAGPPIMASTDSASGGAKKKTRRKKNYS